MLEFIHLFLLLIFSNFIINTVENVTHLINNNNCILSRSLKYVNVYFLMLFSEWN